jgi:hypothetical protein
MRLSAATLDLFNRVADGVQSEDDERQLAALLKRDAAACEEFQQLMELHSTLHWLYVAAAVPPRRLPGVGGGGASRWIAAAVAGFVLLGAAAGGVGTALRWGPLEPAADSLGVVEQARLVVPAGGGRALRSGDPVAAGRLAIESGVVGMRLRNGVQIVLEGPGELELLDDMAAFLHSGKAVVRMPKGMSGFRLDTATTGVLDLGTEFAVKAGLGLVTDVQVYDGEVLATRKAGETGMQFPKRLVAGEAARFEPGNEGLPRPIPYSEGRFIRNVPTTPGVELQHVTEPEERIRQFGRMLFDSIPVMPAAGPVVIDGDLADWNPEPGFKEVRHSAFGDNQWAAGWMMYDADHLYIGAHVGDPHPLRSMIDPELDAELGWQGGGLQVRLSTDRAMGWPADGDAPSYYSARGLEPTAADREKAKNPRLAHLTMWHHAPSGKPCITVAQGMNLNDLALNPPGVVGAFRRDADGRGYVVEYAIPWRVLRAEERLQQFHLKGLQPILDDFGDVRVVVDAQYGRRATGDGAFENDIIGLLVTTHGDHS